MLGDCDLVAFVSTADPGRAAAFYGDVLGLELVSESPFALVYNAHGTMLRVTTVERHKPASQTVLGWAVTDIDAAVVALSAAGVALIQYEGMDQDDTGIWRSPSGARIGWFTDPDGNVLSVTQF